MLEIVLSNQFKKDIKSAQKRGYADFRECHIKPDWLLIYRIDNEDLLLFLFRTGSHSDLF